MSYEPKTYKGYEYARSITYRSDNPSPQVSQAVKDIVVFQGYTNGVTNPNFKVQIARGADASTPYSRSGWESNATRPGHASGHAIGLTPATRVDAEWLCLGQPQVNFTSDVQTQNVALQRFKRQLSSRLGRSEVLAPLAEMRELSGLVRTTCSYAVDFLTAVAAAKRSHGRSFAKYLGKNWLTFNFGMAPMLADIANVGHSIADYIAKEDLDERLTASATKSGQYSYTPASAIAGTAVPFAASEVFTGQASYTLGYKYTGSIAVDMVSGNDYNALDHFGVTFAQIPATLWELTAFSWLFDYFSNIGDFLSDVFTTQPGVTKYLVMTRRYRMDYVHECRRFWLPNNGNRMVQDSSVPSLHIGNVFEFQRTPLSAVPRAGLYIKSMDSIALNSVSKVLNLLSIVA